MKSKKACPFCGDYAIEIVTSVPPATTGLQIQCDNCGARGPVYPTKEDAIDGWELGASDNT